MAAIKSFTSLEQSMKLAEILPLESADMFYNEEPDETYPKDIVDTKYPMVIREGQKHYLEEYGIPCWSLAALFGVLPISIDEGQHCLALINSNPNGDIEWLCCYEDYKGNLMTACYGDNQVDACIEMIYKLKEVNLL